MRRFGILLSGCGGLDGSEPVEALAAALSIIDAGDQVIPIAPDQAQTDAYDPISGEALFDDRNCRSEAARLFRGRCRALAQVGAHHLDALFIPGGLGVVKTLCSIAIEGSGGSVLSSCGRLLTELREEVKPIGAIAEGAVLLGASRPGRGLHLAAGNDELLRSSLQALGHHPVEGGPDSLVVEEETRWVTAAGAAGSELEGSARAARAVIDRLRDWIPIE